MNNPEVTVRFISCPNAHRIRLEVVAGTPNRIQPIQCPTCDVSFIVFAGDLRGVLPEDAE